MTKMKIPEVKRYGQLGGLTKEERSKWRERWRTERSGTPKKILRMRNRAMDRSMHASYNEHMRDGHDR
jgi:hypothetical protein